MGMSPKHRIGAHPCRRLKARSSRAGDKQPSRCRAVQVLDDEEIADQLEDQLTSVASVDIVPVRAEKTAAVAASAPVKPRAMAKAAHPVRGDPSVRRRRQVPVYRQQPQTSGSSKGLVFLLLGVILAAGMVLRGVLVHEQR